MDKKAKGKKRRALFEKKGINHYTTWCVKNDISSAVVYRFLMGENITIGNFAKISEASKIPLKKMV